MFAAMDTSTGAENDWRGVYISVDVTRLLVVRIGGGGTRIHVNRWRSLRVCGKMRGGLHCALRVSRSGGRRLRLLRICAPACLWLVRVAVGRQRCSGRGLTIGRAHWTWRLARLLLKWLRG